MGIGGLLMWTAVAQEINKQTGKKVLIKEGNKIITDKILKHNSILTKDENEDNIFILNIQFKILPERITKHEWNTNRHTIISRSKYFGFNNPELKCIMEYVPHEIKYIKKNILNKLPKDFIIIEPNAKTKWCAQKQFPLHKWQNIVDNIYQKIPIVQMSIPGNKILNNVINISNDIRNFREASLIIKYCKLFISTEGALMHACSIHNKKCIIIYPPLFNPIMTEYPCVDTIWIKSYNHFNCFKEKDCIKCRELMNNFDENIIINKINTYL